MSDDDYAADSPFDGGDDYYYWDDAASQDVADDLAEHTMPSPVYLEDPAYEMMGGYSDWEYYSDDYYDDDPNLLKKNPQAGSPPASLNFRKGQANSHKAQSHGRKRKLADTEEISSLSLDRPELVKIVQNIGHNIAGTIWKTNQSESDELYHQGEATRVALLKDWRSVFRESQPKSDRRSKGRSGKRAALPDGWANDLSLADMGLMTATGKHVSTNDIDNDYDEDEDEDRRNAPDEYFEDVLSNTEERSIPVGPEADIPARIQKNESEDFYVVESIKNKLQPLGEFLPSRKRKNLDDDEAGPNGHDPDSESDIELQLVAQMLPISKKRKTGLEPSTSARSTQKSKTVNTVGDPESQANGTQKRIRGRPRKEIVQYTEDESTSTLGVKNAIAKPATASASNKKRKATTESAAGNDDAEAVLASSRAKRVAADKKGMENENGNQPKTLLAEPTTRRTRTRKK